MTMGLAGRAAISSAWWSLISSTPWAATASALARVPSTVSGVVSTIESSSWLWPTAQDYIVFSYLLSGRKTRPSTGDTVGCGWIAPDHRWREVADSVLGWLRGRGL